MDLQITSGLCLSQMLALECSREDNPKISFYAKVMILFDFFLKAMIQF